MAWSVLFCVGGSVRVFFLLCLLCRGFCGGLVVCSFGLCVLCWSWFFFFFLFACCGLILSSWLLWFLDVYIKLDG